MKKWLYCFDLDGTLVSSYMETESRDINEWSLLPGRAEVIAGLLRKGLRIAIVSNQAGVAFNYVTEERVIQKFIDVREALGLDDWYTYMGPARRYVQLGLNERVAYFGRSIATWLSVGEDLDLVTQMTIHVCYAHPKSRDMRYNDPTEVQRRKPSPTMLYEAMRIHEAAPAETVFVGDMNSDRDAAVAAGVAYFDAEEFFK
jgi:histidinol phosphatase-like enzyme